MPSTIFFFGKNIFCKELHSSKIIVLYAIERKNVPSREWTSRRLRREELERFVNSKTSSSSPAQKTSQIFGVGQAACSLVCAYAGLKTTAPYSRPEPTLSRGSYVFFSIGVRLLFTLNRSGMENSAWFYPCLRTPSPVGLSRECLAHHPSARNEEYASAPRGTPSLLLRAREAIWSDIFGLLVGRRCRLGRSVGRSKFLLAMYPLSSLVPDDLCLTEASTDDCFAHSIFVLIPGLRHVRRVVERSGRYLWRSSSNEGSGLT